jgi:putative ABC transport system permease protein
MYIIRDAHSYDTFHPESERTYRIITEALRKAGGEESYASSPFAVGRTLTDDYSQVEMWIPLVNNFGGEVESKPDNIYVRGLYTNSHFFEMFGFTLATGDQDLAFTEPYTVVLTEDLAKRLFHIETNFESLIGKFIEVGGYDTPFRITGVLHPFPGKTHFQFDALVSLETVYAMEKMPDANQMTTEFRDYYSTYNFVRLKEGASVHETESALADISQHKLAGLELESRDRGYNYTLQRLDKITPGRNLSQSMGNGLPAIVLWFMTILGAIIMLTGCFNYTNLTIARSLVRAKEVGVRKVLGARRSQLFWQLIGESMLTSFLSLAFSYAVLKVIKVVAESVGILDMTQPMNNEDLTLYGLFIAFATVVGFIAGALPAAALSRTSPVVILQKFQNVRMMQRVGLRKVLLGFQFTVTLVFLFLMTIVWRQVNHGLKLNFGFDQPQTLLVEMSGVPYEKLSTAFSQVSGVEKISAISHSMGTWQDSYVDVRSDSITEKTGARDYFIDHHYLDHFNIELIAGEDFPENLQQQQELFAIVNETFCRQYKLGDPKSAVGKPLVLGDSTQVVVRGVVKDFFFKPSTYSIEPLILRYSPRHLTMMNVKLSGTDMPMTLAALERTWNEIEKEQPLSSQFYDVTVRQNYQGFLTTAYTVGFLGTLGMIIACLGLLGMAIYTVESREKEVSIRKVMGAGFKDIVFLLSKGYLWVLLISISLAVPLSFFLGSQALRDFAQRVPWSPLAFIPGILAIFFFAGLTIGSQTMRAAFSDPVEALRNE